MKWLEERLEALATQSTAQEAKIDEVEKLATKKGGLMQVITQYGAPFALWYGTCWAGMLFSIYMLLELGIISWQESLRPLLESLGLADYADRIDPSMGNLVIAFVVNELIEPVRFPFVLATGIPVIKAARKMLGKG